MFSEDTQFAAMLIDLFSSAEEGAQILPIEVGHMIMYGICSLEILSINIKMIQLKEARKFSDLTLQLKNGYSCLT